MDSIRVHGHHIHGEEIERDLCDRLFHCSEKMNERVAPHENKSSSISDDEKREASAEMNDGQRRQSEAVNQRQD